MSILKLFTKEFDTIKVAIDITTFVFDSMIEDYDYDNPKSFNTISFVLANESETENTVNEIKKGFQLNLANPEDIDKYIRVRDTFQDWEKDTRKRIIINFKSGVRGFRNPSCFSFE